MSSKPTGARTVRAPRGTQLSCRGWQQEAALRMLMNNLDPDVAEKFEEDAHMGYVGGGTNLSRRYGGYAVVACSVLPAELRRGADQRP